MAMVYERHTYAREHLQWTFEASANNGALPDKCARDLSLSRARVRWHLFHDPFDGVGAPSALMAAAEVVVDLAHPRPSSGLRNSGPKLLVAEHVARADDHCLLLRSLDREGRFEDYGPGHVVRRGRHHRLVDLGELLLATAALDADGVERSGCIAVEKNLLTIHSPISSAQKPLFGELS